MEVWKPVTRNASYEASNKGKIRHIQKHRIIPQPLNNGYKQVSLRDTNNKKSLTIRTHRIIATEFVENPNDLKYVNHKDGDKENNNAENLEWVTSSANSRHAYDTGLKKPTTKRVIQYSIDNEFIKVFNSIVEAAKEVKISDRRISDACRTESHELGGYIWKYEIEEDRNVPIPEGLEIKNFPNYILTKDAKLYSKRAKKFLKSKQTISGYKIVKLSKNKIVKEVYLHVLMREYFETPIKSLVQNQEEKSTDGSCEK